MAGALDGIVVADFTRVLAGPYCTMLLADMGAEVIKVERPGSGDDTRSWGPPFDPDGRATYFEAVNRNKTSVAIDLAGGAGQWQARDLVERADVLIENFAPGTLERFGLGWEQVHRHRPALVYCSISGFGSGAGAELPGYDLLAQAVGGLMSVTGPHPDTPTKAGVAVTDVITGLHATVGILAALRHRDATGNGQLVEVSLLTSLLSGLVNQTSAVLNGEVVPGITGNAHPSIVPYETYPTGDRQIVIAVGNDSQFRRLCRVLGSEEWADDPRFNTNPSRVQHRQELNPLLEQRLTLQPADHWLPLLTAAGVPAGPINSVAEAIDLAAALGLDPVHEIDHPTRNRPFRTVAHPIRFSQTPARYDTPPPPLPS